MNASGVEIGTPYGQCPVQSEGFIDGQPYYFRARGASWSIGIGGGDPVTAPDWEYEEDYGAWPDAGYMSEAVAVDFIRKAVQLFRTANAGGGMRAGEAPR